MDKDIDAAAAKLGELKNLFDYKAMTTKVRAGIMLKRHAD
jgi:hypothetical protein